MYNDMKDCVKQHPMLHTLFGVGLGMFLVAVFPFFGMVWLGSAVMGGAFLADYLRKR